MWTAWSGRRPPIASHACAPKGRKKRRELSPPPVGITRSSRLHKRRRSAQCSFSAPARRGSGRSRTFLSRRVVARWPGAVRRPMRTIPHPRQLLMRKWTAQASKNLNNQGEAQYRPRRCDLHHTACDRRAGDHAFAASRTGRRRRSARGSIGAFSGRPLAVHPRAGMLSPRWTAGRARPRSSQAGVCLSALKSTNSPAS